ncbi:MAG: TROVE domain-containing protein [Saprospiraceae bacterium]
MARFNAIKTSTSKTENLAGGQAYRMSHEAELVNILLNCFLDDQFYRSAEDTMKRIVKLLIPVNPEFVAKAAVYARREFGLRSVTHFIAAEMVAAASGKAWGAKFYDRIVRRPDDMLEIMAAFRAIGSLNPTNAMKKGFAKAFDRFDSYQLAKYRGVNREIKLVDIVNLVHPKPTIKNVKALKALMADELRNTKTWEAMLTKAGQSAENEVQKTEMNAEAWRSLLSEGRLGYLALLRNLRNILNADVKLIPLAAEALTNEAAIRGSLVMPFQIFTAYKVVEEFLLASNKSDLKMRKKRKVKRPDTRIILLRAIGKAMEISLSNVPKFDGKTLVVLDDSGSMTCQMRKNYSSRTCIEIGALFAAALVHANDADLMRFSDNASYVKAHVKRGYGKFVKLVKYLIQNARSGGTNFHSIFQCANQAYRRIIILSDMQGWVGSDAPNATFEEYRRTHKASPYVYSFDLTGYGTIQLPDNKTFLMAGFSDKIFDVMKHMETDRISMVKMIKNLSWDEL